MSFSKQWKKFRKIDNLRNCQIGSSMSKHVKKVWIPADHLKHFNKFKHHCFTAKSVF